VFRAWCLELTVQGLGFRVQDLELRVESVRLRVEVSELRVCRRLLLLFPGILSLEKKGRPGIAGCHEESEARMVKVNLLT